MRFLVLAVALHAHAASAETRVVHSGSDAFAIDVVVDDRPIEGDGRVDSRLIYLNRTGVTLTQGSTDARRNRSSLVTGKVAVPAWNPSAEIWADTVACLREVFAPFDVRFTESDPGSDSHVEAVFGGNGTLLGMPVRPAGAAPMSTSCRTIENAVVFAFTDDLPANPRKICEVMAQEIGHSYGLDHELLASDPMSYLSFAGERTFQDTLADCGETSTRECGVPGYASCRAQQNSYALLLERLGPAPDADDPDTGGANASVTDDETTDELGCRATGGSSSLVVALWLAACPRRRRSARL